MKLSGGSVQQALARSDFQSARELECHGLGTLAAFANTAERNARISVWSQNSPVIRSTAVMRSSSARTRNIVFPFQTVYSDVAAAPLMCAGLIGYRSLRMAGDARRLGIYGLAPLDIILSLNSPLTKAARCTPSRAPPMPLNGACKALWGDLDGPVGRSAAGRT
jgi:hypothetical protein